MSEMYYAEMESARNDAEAKYFDARPLLKDTGRPEMNDLYRRIFRAGFERAFTLLWRDPTQTEGKQ